MATPTDPATRALAPVMAYAFAPVHKRALGIAFGLTFGLLIALLTVLHVVVLEGQGPELSLLGQFFYGYDISWRGVGIGFFWGFISGFVAGWFMGFLRNLFTAIWIFSVKTKAELSQPFLDHI